jgi:hypothetical protein
MPSESGTPMTSAISAVESVPTMAGQAPYWSFCVSQTLEVRKLKPISRKAGQPPITIDSMIPASSTSTKSAERKLAFRKMRSNVPLGVPRGRRAAGMLIGSVTTAIDHAPAIGQLRCFRRWLRDRTGIEIPVLSDVVSRRAIRRSACPTDRSRPSRQRGSGP